jgi:hypothetical protein
MQKFRDYCPTPDKPTPFTRLTRFGEAGRNRALEPASAIRDPPTQEKNWNGCAQRPPHRQNEIGSEAQDSEREPEHLSFHAPSLSGTIEDGDGRVFELSLLITL